MKDCLTMWKYPKMIVLAAICAAIYAALLIPFKSIVIFGVEFRVATVIVPTVGVLFGPAGAWGIAFGNLIGDFFGSMSVSSIFGFIANFFFAYIPYKIWYIGKDIEPNSNNAPKIIRFLIGTIGGSLQDIFWLCFGVSAVFSQLPYTLFVSIIGVTNGVLPLILGSIILSLVGTRIKRWGLAFTNIMQPEDVKLNTKLNIPGGILAIAAPAAAIIISLIMGTQGIDVGAPLVWVSLPALIISIIGINMIGMSEKAFDKE